MSDNYEQQDVCPRQKKIKVFRFCLWLIVHGPNFLPWSMAACRGILLAQFLSFYFVANLKYAIIADCLKYL